jgi:hypothetical protein
MKETEKTGPEMSKNIIIITYQQGLERKLVLVHILGLGHRLGPDMRLSTLVRLL